METNKRTYQKAVVNQIFDKEVKRKDGSIETIKDTRFVADIGAYIPDICKHYKVEQKVFYDLSAQESFEKILELGKIAFEKKAQKSAVVSKEKIITNIQTNASQFSKEEREKIAKALGLI